MYQAVVFDIDGTVVDSHFLMNAARDAYLDIRGTNLPEEIFWVLYGSPVKDHQQIMGLSNEEYAHFNECFQLHLPKYIGQQRIYDGIKETMQALKKMGMILAINTSRTKQATLDASRSMEWDFAAYCDYIMSSDQVRRPKPAPDSLFLLCEMACVYPQEVLFIGDTDFDSICASRAGADFALATWGAAELHPAKYYPSKPTDLIDIVKYHR